MSHLIRIGVYIENSGCTFAHFTVIVFMLYQDALFQDHIDMLGDIKDVAEEQGRLWSEGNLEELKEKHAK